ncbi:phosphatidylethanolamine N-methyltransferase isoform X1 [Tupaia chinensis]|uniref:phosphatidylethanolamine N-methyltransferase isoform X1 n=1 Tax=Tupaia chinensis TaxID=246437 RepID=UPI000FFB5943|nr:phosphatidylethanolamine N-methyltransferase isoform X1 [Tupaia chinensis]
MLRGGSAHSGTSQRWDHTWCPLCPAAAVPPHSSYLLRSAQGRAVATGVWGPGTWGADPTTSLTDGETGPERGTGPDPRPAIQCSGRGPAGTCCSPVDLGPRRRFFSVLEVARWEHRTRKLSRAFRSPHLACYFLGGAILLLNVLRSHCFTQAMLSQPQMESLDNPTAYRLGLAFLGVGVVLVLSSFFALGFTGTFLGDYFGILKEARVTSFPFNVLDNPMYWGSTANYLGWALMHASPSGLLLAAVVGLIYMVAILYEEPFTTEIYQRKASESHRRS